MNKNPVHINIEEDQIMKCQCGGKIFEKLFIIGKVSGLQFGISGPVFVDQQVFVCKSCGTPLKTDK